MIDKQKVKEDLNGIAASIQGMIGELESHVAEIKEFQSTLDNLSDDEIRSTTLVLHNKAMKILGEPC